MYILTRCFSILLLWSSQARTFCIKILLMGIFETVSLFTAKSIGKLVTLKLKEMLKNSNLKWWN